MPTKGIEIGEDLCLFSDTAQDHPDKWGGKDRDEDDVKSIFKYNDYFLCSSLAIRSEIVKKADNTRDFQPVSVGLLGKILVIKDEEWFKDLNVI